MSSRVARVTALVAVVAVLATVAFVAALAAAFSAASVDANIDAPLSSISATPAEPENVMSAWATPAARTSDVVVRRMRLVYVSFELK
jgi:hypothetical protein